MTELYQVPDLSSGLQVAHQLGARAIFLDLEGVIMPFVGNTPTDYDIDRALGGSQEPLSVLKRDMTAHPDTKYAIATNNTNATVYHRSETGLVTEIARLLEIPFAHKGMEYRGKVLAGKPAPDELQALGHMVEVDPEETVFIDDQALKNAGAAVAAGLRAVVVPPPFGRRGWHGRVIEHPGVMASRFVEQGILRSYARGGVVGQRVMHHFNADGLRFGSLPRG